MCCPTEPELEAMFQVSRTTVRKAIGILQSQGLISVRQGYGTIVLSNQPEDHYHKFHNVTGIREVFLCEDERFTLRGSRIEATAASGKVAKALEGGGRHAHLPHAAFALPAGCAFLLYQQPP